MMMLGVFIAGMMVGAAVGIFAAALVGVSEDE